MLAATHPHTHSRPAPTHQQPWPCCSPALAAGSVNRMQLGAESSLPVVCLLGGAHTHRGSRAPCVAVCRRCSSRCRLRTLRASTPGASSTAAAAGRPQPQPQPQPQPIQLPMALTVKPATPPAAVVAMVLTAAQPAVRAVTATQTVRDQAAPTTKWQPKMWKTSCWQPDRPSGEQRSCQQLLLHCIDGGMPALCVQNCRCRGPCTMTPRMGSQRPRGAQGVLLPCPQICGVPQKEAHAGGPPVRAVSSGGAGGRRRHRRVRGSREAAALLWRVPPLQASCVNRLRGYYLSVQSVSRTACQAGSGARLRTHYKLADDCWLQLLRLSAGLPAGMRPGQRCRRRRRPRSGWRRCGAASASPGERHQGCCADACAVLAARLGVLKQLSF